MNLKNLLLYSVTVFAFTLLGCGGGGDEAPATSGTETTTTEAPPAAPAGTAKVMGSVNFTGTAPERSKIKQDRDCTALHTEDVLSEQVVVNDNNTLQHVFVHVTGGLEGQTFAAPSTPVVLDQQGCMYTPHVIGVMVGQPIKILNSDPFLHNINALAEVNRGFNFGMPNQGDERERSFRAEEVMVKVKCDVHPWMSAYVGVLSHPYHSVTGTDGTFSLEGLPAGEYTVEAWHETYGTQTQTVTVGDGETATVDFSFSEGAAG